jgi:single-stranded DNA-binding protein
MTIEALITGKLRKRAEERTGRSGRPFVTASVRAAAGEGESLFVNVCAFSESACLALLALDAGDSVAVAGSMTPKAWTDREGNARPSVDMVAAQVMTLYGLKKRRAAATPTEGAEDAPQARLGTQQRQHEADDFGPQDWPGDDR